eukprot:TRINITY_DN19287_c0_g1_i9.p1 TRINITY_DN19287_c0_g1~~TRINITY_DN19287_c0_g1_i9.p1  ORF type:complete len:407 (+),score=38.30 TRINITY_DN19287_c0_g1_i9:213-1433(+)
MQLVQYPARSKSMHVNRASRGISPSFVRCLYSVHASKLAVAAKAVVMLIDYPLVPMGNYKSILTWSLKAWQWLADHGPEAQSCATSPRPPMFVFGDSSGGGTALSLLLTLNAEADLWPAATGYIGESAWLNLNCDTSSYYSQAFSESESQGEINFLGDMMYQQAPGTSTIHFRSFAKWYCGRTCGVTGGDLKDPFASPFWANESMLQGLPPLYFVSSSTELLSGDSVNFARRAAAAGVHVYLDQFAGMWHTFPQWSEGKCAGNGSDPLWQGKLAIQRMGSFVQQVAAESELCPTAFKRPVEPHEPQTLVRLLSPGSLQSPPDLEIKLCSLWTGAQRAPFPTHQGIWVTAVVSCLVTSVVWLSVWRLFFFQKPVKPASYNDFEKEMSSVAETSTTTSSSGSSRGNDV